jgi:hypothetical protein
MWGKTEMWGRRGLCLIVNIRKELEIGYNAAIYGYGYSIMMIIYTYSEWNRDIEL